MALPAETEVEPQFDAYRDVRLLLSTRRNRGSPFRIAFRNFDSIRSSPFDAAKPTRILVRIKIHCIKEVMQKSGVILMELKTEVQILGSKGIFFVISKD